MASVRMRLAVPDEPELLDRLAAALAAQGEPAISVARGRTAVLTFEAATGEMMLRSRVIHALEEAAGGGWQGLVEPVGLIRRRTDDRRPAQRRRAMRVAS